MSIAQSSAPKRESLKSVALRKRLGLDSPREMPPGPPSTVLPPVGEGSVVGSWKDALPFSTVRTEASAASAAAKTKTYPNSFKLRDSPSLKKSSCGGDFWLMPKWVSEDEPGLFAKTGIGLDGTGKLTRNPQWALVPPDVKDYGNDPVGRKVGEIRDSKLFKAFRSSPRGGNFDFAVGVGVNASSSSAKQAARSYSPARGALGGKGTASPLRGGQGRQGARPGSKFGVASLREPPPGRQAIG